MSEILFVNGAIQNRGFELDESPGKMAGIMLATILNRLSGNQEVVHMWNNVGAFHEFEPLDTATRIEQKYSSNVMTEYMNYWGLSREVIAVLEDDEEKFVEWATDQVAGMLEAGVVTIEEARFDACNNCDMVIAESVVGVDCCTSCVSTDLSTRTEKALFVTVPEDRSRLLDESLIYNSMNLRNEVDSLKQIPPRLLLSRDRQIGVDLSELGLEDKKLDPRLGIGMLAIYAAEIYDFETVAMTQSSHTLIRTAPYIGSVLVKQQTDRRLLYVPHMRIEKSILQEANGAGRQVIAPFASAQTSRNVNEHAYNQAQKEFAKLARNAQALFVILERLGIEGGAFQPSFMPDKTGLTNSISKMGKRSGRAIEELKRKSINDLLPTDAVEDAQEVMSIAQALYITKL